VQAEPAELRGGLLGGRGVDVPDRPPSRLRAREHDSGAADAATSARDHDDPAVERARLLADINSSWKRR
jgi:hypothetical protein